MAFDSPDFIISILKIIWIDILLSGDNAVVIALACRQLPREQRMWGILLGAGAAILLRVAFMFVVAQLLAIPFLKLVSGALLLWIAIKLVIDDSGEHEVKSASNLWGAVRTIAIADAVMSLDNVVAIAAAAKGSFSLMVFGVALTIPLIVFGSSVMLRLMQAYPIIVWAGAGLLGWVAGELMLADPALHDWLIKVPYIAAESLHYVGAVLGAAFVLAVAFMLHRRKKSEAAA
jgi:YjbE family integral membrane protein